MVLGLLGPECSRSLNGDSAAYTQEGLSDLPRRIQSLRQGDVLLEAVRGTGVVRAGQANPAGDPEKKTGPGPKEQARSYENSSGNIRKNRRQKHQEQREGAG